MYCLHESLELNSPMDTDLWLIEKVSEKSRLKGEHLWKKLSTFAVNRIKTN